MDAKYTKVAYIGLRNADGSYLMSVPLYVKVDDITKYGVSQSQEELIHKVADVMMRRYEKQITTFMASKKQKGENENE